MTFIGKHLPELVPFMEDTYTPQAVNQARNSFKRKVRKASATFFYGAMCGFFTTDELDDLLFEASEVSRFLLEVEGTTLDIDDEIDIEDRITTVMRSVGEAAKTMLKSRVEENNVQDIALDTSQNPQKNNHDAIKNPDEMTPDENLSIEISADQADIINRPVIIENMSPEINVQKTSFEDNNQSLKSSKKHDEGDSIP
jgi:hypothetical protein